MRLHDAGARTREVYSAHRQASRHHHPQRKAADVSGNVKQKQALRYIYAAAFLDSLGVYMRECLTHMWYNISMEDRRTALRQEILLVVKASGVAITGALWLGLAFMSEAGLVKVAQELHIATGRIKPG